MKKGNQIIQVIEWFIIENWWEYYVIEVDGDNIAFCLVDGYETELGDVDLEEVRPYIKLRTKELNTIMPAPGWQWID